MKRRKVVTPLMLIACLTFPPPAATAQVRGGRVRYGGLTGQGGW